MLSYSDPTLKEKLERLNPVVIDTETTGTNPCTHQLLALALAPLDAGIPHFSIFVKPERIRWSEGARTYFDAYRHNWETSAVSSPDAILELETYLSENFAGPVTLIGHNVGFDLAFLRSLFAEAHREDLPLVSHRTIDTHTLLMMLYLEGRIPEEAVSSDGGFKHFGIGVPNGSRHTALGDAIATRELFKQLLAATLEADLQSRI